MTEEDKLVSFREISRLFAHEEAAKEIMSKTRRVINFRIEDLKRETVTSTFDSFGLIMCRKIINIQY